VAKTALGARENKIMEIKVKWNLDHISEVNPDENERWRIFMKIVWKAGDDQYTHVDGIPKLLRQLIVKIVNETSAKRWEYVSDGDLFGEHSYIVFYYDFKPTSLTEKERMKLNQEIKQIAVSSEGVCEHFEYMHHENVAKKCENCFFYGFWGSTPVCYRNEEKLVELVPVWHKVDEKGKRFQTKKSVEIHLIVESFVGNVLKEVGVKDIRSMWERAYKNARKC
jgi:hypothetical protein